MSVPLTIKPIPDWPRAVVFDLDGTLIDSVGDIAAALNRTMAAHNLPSFTPEQVKTFIGGGVSTLIERALKTQKPERDKEQAAMVDDFLRFYEADLTSHTVIYEGARALLDELKAEGRILGLCTNKPHHLAFKSLQQLDLLPYFGSVIGELEGRAKKPAPEPLHLVLTELGVEPASAVMVGDSHADIGCAKAAGVRSVAVRFGYSRTPVEDLGADFIISTLADLPKCWQLFT